MQISSVKIKRVNNDNSPIKAYASICFDSLFVIHGIALIEKTNGFYLSMPFRKTKDNKRKDIVHPLSTEFRQEILQAILEEYKKE